MSTIYPVIAPTEAPKVNINNVRENIDDYCLEDFVIDNYECHLPIKMKMRK